MYGVWWCDDICDRKTSVSELIFIERKGDWIELQLTNWDNENATEHATWPV